MVFEAPLLFGNTKQLGKIGKLYSYLSANHLVIGDNLELAIAGNSVLSRRIMLIQDGSLE